MGNTDDEPQPGFDHWVSFRGQGVYYKPTLNIDGKRVPQPEGSYTSDLLTEQAIDWLNKRNKQKLFLFTFLIKVCMPSFSRQNGMKENMQIFQ